MTEATIDATRCRRFEGKVAIVAGSSVWPSIGRACARRLAAEGASVVVNGRDAAHVADTEKALSEAGYAVTGVVGDLEDAATPAALVDAALETFGRLDLLVNTVGGTRYVGPILDMPRDSLMSAFNINTWTALALVQEAMHRGLSGGAAVVNISSGTVHKTTPSNISYTAAKAALNAMTRTLARDLAPRGIRVNAVAPGLTRTTSARSLIDAVGEEAAGASMALGRLTEAEDIAATAAFLLSDDACAVTGVTVDVDGGNHLVGWSPVLVAEAKNKAAGS